MSWSGLSVAQQLERVLQLRVLVGVWKHEEEPDSSFARRASGNCATLFRLPHRIFRTGRARHRARVLSQAFFAVITHPT